MEAEDGRLPKPGALEVVGGPGEGKPTGEGLGPEGPGLCAKVAGLEALLGSSAKGSCTLTLSAVGGRELGVLLGGRGILLLVGGAMLLTLLHPTALLLDAELDAVLATLPAIIGGPGLGPMLLLLELGPWLIMLVGGPAL